MGLDTETHYIHGEKEKNGCTFSMLPVLQYLSKRKGFGAVGEGLRENFQPRFELTILGMSIQSADH